MHGGWLVLGVAALVVACEFGSMTDTSGGDATDTGSGGSTMGADGTGAGPSTASMDGGGSGDDAPGSGSGDPPTSCVDANGGCAENATCDDTAGSVVCTCADGFVGDGFRCAPEGESMLRRLHYENPCAGQLTIDCPWENFCVMANEATDRATFSGEAGVVYDVTLRFRGVVSQVYVVGGETDEHWNVGGEPMPEFPFHPVRLDVSDPPGSYVLNAGPDQAEYCVQMDYEHVVPIAAGAEVTLGHYDTNNCATINQDAEGAPITVDGVDVKPQPYDGQFFLVDLVSAAPSG